jgi:hypothetical protein
LDCWLGDSEQWRAAHWREFRHVTVPA